MSYEDILNPFNLEEDVPEEGEETPLEEETEKKDADEDEEEEDEEV